MNKIEINRETKIVLLNALKNGYFELPDLENITAHLYKNLTDEELNNRIKELSRKLGIEPLTIEVIDRREQVIMGKDGRDLPPARVLTKAELIELHKTLENEY
ncbi:hypothetical protein FACS1894182_03430 [Bacteroidia bacterium]|nr:hypothetical protein FACS1894182_03430 [Bacteroidia bacterium]